jgi:hypothetical protein
MSWLPLMMTSWNWRRQTMEERQEASMRAGLWAGPKLELVQGVVMLRGRR